MNKLFTYAALSLLFSLAACSKKEETQEETPVSEIKLTAEQKTNAGIEFGTLVEKEMSTEIKCTGVVDVPPVRRPVIPGHTRQKLPLQVLSQLLY